MTAIARGYVRLYNGCNTSSKYVTLGPGNHNTNYENVRKITLGPFTKATIIRRSKDGVVTVREKSNGQRDPEDLETSCRLNGETVTFAKIEKLPVLVKAYDVAESFNGGDRDDLLMKLIWIIVAVIILLIFLAIFKSISSCSKRY